jgi:hypothetical protein
MNRSTHRYTVTWSTSTPRSVSSSSTSRYDSPKRRYQPTAKTITAGAGTEAGEGRLRDGTKARASSHAGSVTTWALSRPPQQCRFGRIGQDKGLGDMGTNERQGHVLNAGRSKREYLVLAEGICEDRSAMGFISDIPLPAGAPPDEEGRWLAGMATRNQDTFDRVVEVVRAVEAQQRALLDELRADPSSTRPTRCARSGSTSRLRRCGPMNGSSSRSTPRACRGKEPAKRLLEDAIDAWLAPIADLLASQGLLLDLLATGDVTPSTRRWTASPCCTFTPGLSSPGAPHGILAAPRDAAAVC